jgi:hypothetical protein
MQHLEYVKRSGLERWQTAWVDVEKILDDVWTTAGRLRGHGNPNNAGPAHAPHTEREVELPLQQDEVKVARKGWTMEVGEMTRAKVE